MTRASAQQIKCIRVAPTAIDKKEQTRERQTASAETALCTRTHKQARERQTANETRIWDAMRFTGPPRASCDTASRDVRRT